MHAPLNRGATAYLGSCLVTGAAGFVGKHLVRALLERGLRVRALVRNSPLLIQHDNLECMHGDIQNAQQMLLACAGIDTVFHTAAISASLGDIWGAGGSLMLDALVAKLKASGMV